MGMLIDGRWTEEIPPETGAGGEFRRIASAFRDRITADGSSASRPRPGAITSMSAITARGRTARSSFAH